MFFPCNLILYNPWFSQVGQWKPSKWRTTRRFWFTQCTCKFVRCACISNIFCMCMLLIWMISWLTDHLSLVCSDISSNNLTGALPPSMKSLASLTTLWAYISPGSCYLVFLFLLPKLISFAVYLLCDRRMQDNQLSGTLNVLQDLPLKDL
jgi:hypothetical protein